MEPFFAGLWYRGLPVFKKYALGYMNNDAIAVLVGTIIEDLRIGYSYDITISRLATAGGGAHGITIGYELVQRHKKRAATSSGASCLARSSRLRRAIYPQIGADGAYRHRLVKPYPLVWTVCIIRSNVP
ncbi:MAG: type IX secretion system membrane protein PorP/SprF [Flavobacteriales bacterium]